MSLKWDQEISANRVYLPAEEQYALKDDDGVPIDREIINYVKQEFPFPEEGSEKTVRYFIPRNFVQHGEEQGSMAERISYERFQNVQLPGNINGFHSSNGLWIVCFQGITYAGRFKKSCRGGKIMTREHDLVVFATYRGNYYASLVEVKSTCDNPSLGLKVSDAIGVKNNKRSGQHQLQDHAEILRNTCQISDDELQCYLFWPFLNMWTTDPRGKRIRRWEKEQDLHVFEHSLGDQAAFNEWMFKTILCGKTIKKCHFDTLLKRFVILSCGIFVNEIHEGMMALLSQEQVNLIYKKPFEDGSPTIVHGAAGTGKTLLVLHKLLFLYENGLLNERNRALYICYWPGIRADFKMKLEKLKIAEYVDTTRFFISREDFMYNVRKKYRHIFMDECEAICLAFNENIVSRTFNMIETCRLTEYDEDFYRKTDDLHIENEPLISPSKISDKKLYGELWFLVDINQAAVFIPKHSPNILKKPTITLSRVMRNTQSIYRIFSHFYKNPLPTILAAAKLSDLYLNNIEVGHKIKGPPIYWVNTQTVPESRSKDMLVNKTFNGLIRVIIDLYSTKGVKPSDLCVFPFFVTNAYLPDNVNKAISQHFVTNGYQPLCIQRVEEFLLHDDPAAFLLPWVLRVKGLEFKVVVIAIENGDFDCSDPEDRRKIYIMASRCTCLLIIVSSESVKDTIDVQKVMKPYPFGIDFDSQTEIV